MSLAQCLPLARREIYFVVIESSLRNGCIRVGPGGGLWTAEGRRGRQWQMGAQSTKMDLKTFLEGVRLSPLFRWFGYKQTNSDAIDCPNQPIKLSKSQAVSLLLIPILFLAREAIPEETFFSSNGY